MKLSFRVKHEPACTVYTVQCHDIITLTMPLGYPPGRPGFENAERTDKPERWDLWCHSPGSGYVVSEYASKADARTALLAARRECRTRAGKNKFEAPLKRSIAAVEAIFAAASVETDAAEPR